MHTAVEVNVDPVPPEAATASLVHLRRLIAPPPRRRAATAAPRRHRHTDRHRPDAVTGMSR
jgi:hypothetical protein